MKKKPATNTLRSSACCSECGGAYEKWNVYERNVVEQNQKTGTSRTTRYLMERRSCKNCGKTQIRSVESKEILQ